MSSPGCPILTRASDTIKIIRDFHPTCLPAFLRGQVVNRNTTKCHNKETFSSFLSRELFRDPLEYLPFCQMQVECHTRHPAVLKPLFFPLRHPATARNQIAGWRRGGASQTMYNQCFSRQHNHKGPYLNCIIKSNNATMCILKMSPQFWQSDSQIKRCSLA